MVDIPEHLLLRSAEARAKALGISVEQALAEMKGETEPTVVAKELKLLHPQLKLLHPQLKLLHPQQKNLQLKLLHLRPQRLIHPKR